MQSFSTAAPTGARDPRFFCHCCANGAAPHPRYSGDCTNDTIDLTADRKRYDMPRATRDEIDTRVACFDRDSDPADVHWMTPI